VTAVHVKTIVQSCGEWSQANEGMGEVGMACPAEAAGGRAIADAKVVLATKR
jgi:hypothetical protein